MICVSLLADAVCDGEKTLQGIVSKAQSVSWCRFEGSQQDGGQAVVDVRFWALQQNGKQRR